MSNSEIDLYPQARDIRNKMGRNMEIKLSVNANSRSILRFAMVVICILGFVYGAKKVWDGYETHRSAQEMQEMVVNFKNNKDKLSLAETLQAGALGLQSVVNPNWLKDLEEGAQKDIQDGTAVCALALFIFSLRQTIVNFLCKFVAAPDSNP